MSTGVRGRMAGGWWGLGLRLAVALATGGIAGAAAADAPARNVRNVCIATFAYVDNGQTRIGGNGYGWRVEQEGWLQAELHRRGRTLEWFPVTGDTGPVINEAFAAGRIDFATYGDLPALILNAAGVRTRMIVPAGSGSDLYLLVPTASTARSIVDLKGRRISLHRSRPWELSFLRLIGDHGLRYADFRMLNLDPKAGAAALAAGNVDAHFANGPLALVLQSKGLGKVIWSSKGSDDYKMRAELWGTQSFIEREPEIAQLVATAFVRAQHWAAQDANRDAVILEATHAGAPESAVRANYDDPSLAWKQRWSPLFDEAVIRHYERAAALAYAQKLIRRPLQTADLLDPRFVPVALSALSLTGFWAPQTATGAGTAPRPVSTPVAARTVPAPAPAPLRPGSTPVSSAGWSPARVLAPVLP